MADRKESGRSGGTGDGWEGRGRDGQGGTGDGQGIVKERQGRDGQGGGCRQLRREGWEGWGAST